MRLSQNVQTSLTFLKLNVVSETPVCQSVFQKVCHYSRYLRKLFFSVRGQYFVINYISTNTNMIRSVWQYVTRKKEQTTQQLFLFIMPWFCFESILYQYAAQGYVSLDADIKCTISVILVICQGCKAFTEYETLDRLDMIYNSTIALIRHIFSPVGSDLKEFYCSW